MRQGWEYKKLGEVAQVVSGATPKTNIEDYWGEGHYWVTPAELNDETIYVNHTERQITDAALSKTNLQLLPKGTVLLSSRAPIGKVAICGVDMYCNQGFKNCICSEQLYNKYLFYFLKDRKEHLNSLGRGATFKEISKSIVEKVDIPLPPKSTQQVIVLELDKINELIRLKKEQLKDYDNLAQSIFYEMFGDPVENEKGWEVKKLGEVCTIERGGSPRPITDFITEAEDGINWIKIGDAIEGSIYISHTKEKIKPEGVKKSRFVHKGDFILSNSMSFGKPYILDIDGCIHDGWLVIHDDSEAFNKLYLYHSLAHPSMYLQFKNMAVGGVVNNLNSKLVRNVDILIPPLHLQQTFASRIEKIERQKSEVQKAITELETLLASRMQYWFE